MPQPLAPLDRSILATLAYFDVFDYPLKVEELWRWLYAENLENWSAIAQVAPADVEQALAASQLQPFIERAGSFITLRNRSNIIATRMERKTANQRKWHRARFAARVLRLVPFVKFIGVVNTLALNNAGPESDIDFFVIVGRGRLWLTRFLVTALIHGLGIRRHGTKIANRVCLSFYVSDAALNLAPLKLTGLDDDVHFTYWVTQFIPLYDRGGVWQEFTAQNRWALNRVPHGFSGTPQPLFRDSAVIGTLRGIPELLFQGFVGRSLEAVVRWVQVGLMKHKVASRRLDPTTDVVVNDNVLKFHENDRRGRYREMFHQRLAEVLGA